MPEPHFSRRGALGLAAAAASTIPVEAAAQSRQTEEKRRLMQGPMLGAVTESSIRVWTRSSHDFEVRVEYALTPDFAGSRLTTPVRAEAANAYVAVPELQGLRPATRYYYRVLMDGEEDRYQRELDAMSFVTAPPAGVRSRFRVAFGSCAKYGLDPIQEIWPVVGDHRPDLFFWLGDNVYADSHDPGIYGEEYRRQRDVPRLQPLLRSTPQLAIWDDHDYGLNDDDRTNPIKARTLEEFKRHWPNPAYGLPEAPGVFFRYAYGGVDFFFLDGRYHRDPNDTPDGPGKTLLGERQLAWLKAGLKASTAPFKLLVSGGGWTQARGPGGDAWSSFLHERDGLFDFIRDEGIGGVVLMSGDTHVGELNAIPWSQRGGYDFYDLVSSPLAQEGGQSWLERRPEARIRQVYFGGPNFGLLDFDLARPDPILRFNVVNYRGQMPWAWFQISASELQNGVATWRNKMDSISRRRREALDSGHSYYPA